MAESGVTTSSLSSDLLAPYPSPWGVVQAQARFKQQPTDFRVTECLDLVPTGEGEHLWLWVEKAGITTDRVAQALAQHLGCEQRAVSYCGLKDKQAVTQQWFSVHLPQNPGLPDWPEIADYRVLSQARSQRKLRRGVHQGNHFQLLLREVVGDRADIEQRLTRLQTEGAPNAFGLQRFGFDGGNVASGLALLAQRAQGRARRYSTRESLWVSAVRSALFNRVLAARIADGRWVQAIAGDAFQLNGRSAVFVPTPDELADCDARLAALAIHPTGPMPGRGEALVQGEALALEQEVLAPWRSAVDALVAADVPAQRRALRVALPDLAWQWLDEKTLQLSFTLPAGAFATAVLATVFHLSAETNDAHFTE